VNPRNYGFSLGNNIGAREAKGEYLVFLNIDTIVDKSWLMELSNVLSESPEVGAAQSKLLLMENPKLIDSVGHFIDWFGVSYVIGHGLEDKGQYNHVTEVFGATGAALVFRKNVFREVGGFDEDFFMLFEEDDLCWRTWLLGYKVLYVPRSVVFHKSGEIRSRDGNLRNIYLARRNRLASIIKNYSTKNLIRFLPVHISLMMAIAFFSKNKMEYLRSLVKAELYVFLNLKNIVQKRRLIQSKRRVSDERLLKAGIIRKPCVADMLASGY
jgi:hypothetical protein